MAVEIKTSRGIYQLRQVGEPAQSDDSSVMVISCEHRGGMEKFGFECKLGDFSTASDPDRLFDQLAAATERQFEQVREAALKSVRSERKLLRLTFSPESGAAGQLEIG